jgi:hypothetical protein
LSAFSAEFGGIFGFGTTIWAVWHKTRPLSPMLAILIVNRERGGCQGETENNEKRSLVKKEGNWADQSDVLGYV